MKQLYTLVLTVCLLVSCCLVQGQGLPTPVFHWRCPSADSLLNFHPATTEALHFDSIPYSDDYTVVVVYKPVVDTEANVWRLVYADSLVRGLTTERIIADSTSIRYYEQTDGKPAIHTLRQSAPDITCANVRLTVGGGDIKVAEVLYYDRRLGNSALRRVQSALAVRYGITLGPVDYVGGNGKRVWHHRRDSALYHHRITGLGHDTASGLHQLRSRSEMYGAVVTLSADSLPQGAYLLIGDNDAPLTFRQDAGGMETLARQWRAQASGVKDAAVSLAFDTRSLPLPTDSLVLLLDDAVVLPSAATANEVRFNGLRLPSDSCSFTLARGTLLWQLAQTGAKGGHGTNGTNGANTTTRSADTNAWAPAGLQTVALYPNPTTGHFNIEVSGASQVQVTIYSLLGTVVATYSGSGRDRYRFTGTLPSGNSYYATVTTENGSQTMRLVVK